REFAILLPHARAALVPAAPGTDTVARYLVASGDYQAALVVRDGVLRDAQDSVPDDPATLRAAVAQAVATGHAGQEATARDRIPARLPVLDRVWGPEHRLTLTARRELADWTGLAGAPLQARNICGDLLPVARRSLGPDDPETLYVWRTFGFWS